MLCLSTLSCYEDDVLWIFILISLLTAPEDPKIIDHDPNLHFLALEGVVVRDS